MQDNILEGTDLLKKSSKALYLKTKKQNEAPAI